MVDRSDLIVDFPRMPDERDARIAELERELDDAHYWRGLAGCHSFQEMHAVIGEQIDRANAAEKRLAEWCRVFPVADPEIARRMVEDRAKAELRMDEESSG